MEEKTLFDPNEMQSPFDVIKEVDDDGCEWWNSQRLARLMGYMKYWNFERLMDKVSAFLQQQKGLDLKEHMVEIEEMARLNNGGWRQVKSVKLSRTACMAIASNADQKRPIVKAARDYFMKDMNSTELATSVEGNVLIYRSSTGKVNVNVLFSNETFWLSQKRMCCPMQALSVTKRQRLKPSKSMRNSAGFRTRRCSQTLTSLSRGPE